MSRKTARDTLFKLVFEYCVIGERNEFTVELLTAGQNADDSKYVSEAFEGIIKEYSFLIGKVTEFSQGFAFDRIYKIDLALMLVAAYEIYFIESIPNSVSANEATELSKIYSTEKSYSYVNGVLASMIKEKKNVGKID